MNLQQKIDEIKEAKNEIIFEAIKHCDSGSLALLRELDESLSIAIDKLKDYKPKVKQLEWQGYIYRFKAITPIGTYGIYKLSENEWELILIGKHADEVFCTCLESAKQAAQKHYEHSIFQCLED